MTLSTSPTSSGSSAEVGSSNSMTFGFHRQRPGDRRALLLAARQEGRILVFLLVQADLVEKLFGPLDGLGLRHLQHMHRRLDDILEDRMNAATD